MVLGTTPIVEVSASNYPPYNIEQVTEEHYRIVLALAGFRQENLKIGTREGYLLIEGGRPFCEDVTYLHRGIAGRAFAKRFQLEESVKVVSAHLDDGLLSIDLVREIPEALKLREVSIQVRDSSIPKTLTHQKT